MRLKDKVSIVTGSGRGIGRGIALQFAKEGSNIVVADVKEDLARRTTEEIEAVGRQALPLKVDVRVNSEVDAVVNETLKKFGRVDVLVNVAGVLTVAPIVELSEEDWDFIMEVNIKGTFLCSRAVARQMIKQGSGGKIICISSNGGKSGFPFEAHYCASKHAVIGFVRSLALELASHKINVNAICPGYIVTDMHMFEATVWAKWMGKTVEQVRAESLATIPWGRFGTPEDIAKVAVFLASEDSEYMTGQALNVTGGNEMH